ncbi:hypothetical protein [Methylobacterium sp. ID0610]|uniref:hypothetical protein n=1 Tax=Methylobacterium carpenticola TaxID=3344827 RepID=UPI0036828792
MRRSVLSAGLLLGLAVATPAAADGLPAERPARTDARARREVTSIPREARAARHRQPRLAAPVANGEPVGEPYLAWMPRNERLPIYNEPPPVFPEP